MDLYVIQRSEFDGAEMFDSTIMPNGYANADLAMAKVGSDAVKVWEELRPSEEFPGLVVGGGGINRKRRVLQVSEDHRYVYLIIKISMD